MTFNVSKNNTIELRDSDLEFLPNRIFRQNALTFHDLFSINRVYKCSAHCNDSPPECKNGGFLNFKCKCTCPDFFHDGGVCERIKTDSDCGGYIDLTYHKASDFIRSPGYPSNYIAGKRCIWFIRGPVGTNINMEMINFDIPENKDAAVPPQKCGHSLQVRYNLIAQEGPRFCGKGLKGKTFTTTTHADSNMMVVKLDTRKGDDDNGDGFAAKVYISYYHDQHIKCNFDNLTFCPVYQDRTENVDWKSMWNKSSRNCPNHGIRLDRWYLSSVPTLSPSNGERARILTAALSGINRCVQFSYYLCSPCVDFSYYCGKSYAGHLLVKTIEDGFEFNVWRRERQYEACEWNQARINIKGIRPYQIVFEAVFGSDPHSCIAIDELDISTGLCTGTGPITESE